MRKGKVERLPHLLLSENCCCPFDIGRFHLLLVMIGRLIVFLTLVEFTTWYDCKSFVLSALVDAPFILTRGQINCFLTDFLRVLEDFHQW